MNSKKVAFTIHTAIWTMIFISPMMIFGRKDDVSWQEMLCMGMSPLSLFVVFYVNYFILTPKYFIGGKRKMYWIVNAAMIVCAGIFVHVWIEGVHQAFDRGKPFSGEPPEIASHMAPLFILRNIFNLTISAAVATATQLAMRWQAIENAKREAESARAKAELQNLRSQINPHFLLNTLNNIYALAGIDPCRAQSAILELGKLLRHILYDNQQEYVSLEGEVQFLSNYFSLMKMRLAPSVDVKFDYSLPSPCRANVAPLIFISLIENAFKHGVSADGPSYVHIRIEADDKSVTCLIRNSNHPKGDCDRSGHGIGLAQVAKRLELMYPGKYEWTSGTTPDGKEYSSKITLYDTKVCNN